MKANHKSKNGDKIVTSESADPTKTLTKERFDEIIAANQEIQKRNPFGSEAHRKAYEAIRHSSGKAKSGCYVRKILR